jgi:hypothetical protein
MEKRKERESMSKKISRISMGFDPTIENPKSEIQNSKGVSHE